jgi:hypothetical protein
MNDILKYNDYSISRKVTLVYLDRVILLASYLLMIRLSFLMKKMITLILTTFKN